MRIVPSVQNNTFQVFFKGKTPHNHTSQSMFCLGVNKGSCRQALELRFFIPNVHAECLCRWAAEKNSVVRTFIVVIGFYISSCRKHYYSAFNFTSVFSVVFCLFVVFFLYFGTLKFFIRLW